MRYAIVDIETTGGKAIRDKITEIAVVLHDGQQIIETYETLINPETYIPYGITQLTGITQEMVQDAPKFYEIAKDIVKLTEGAIFVAHNVRFDYGFLREEFLRLGYTFSRKQLCTVRLSRVAFPGLHSYSLGNLIQHFGIRTDARHRALADALATTELLEMILQQQESADQIKQFVNLGIKESRLPQSFDIEKIHALPEECGVYYFHDQEGNVVYVGKSINIRKRVADHFADPTEKGRKLQQHVYDISYEITGSELVALLLESYEIKRLLPPINRMQRVQQFPYAIHTWEDEDGYIRFEIAHVTARTRKDFQIVSEYPKLGNAKGHLSAKVTQFGLCHRLSSLQNGKGACFHYHLHQCYGACVGKEPPEDYNERARLALESLSTVFDKDFLIIDRGRTPDEHAVILVEEGNYCGYGYVNKEESINDVDTLRSYIKYYSGNPETTRIVQRFLGGDAKVKLITLSS
ncbi:MAG: exonuclease domain-containing protein [Saprospiraceae bacterium]|nr:exonuclease domain-containing protein [Saprospiraceae bacterium]